MYFKIKLKFLHSATLGLGHGKGKHAGVARRSLFLNLRFMLIVTVFAGNAIEPLISRMDGLHGLYMWIFSFHMPLFVLVTGYFAKKALPAAQDAKYSCKSVCNT